jgi:hypothetical protein
VKDGAPAGAGTVVGDGRLEGVGKLVGESMTAGAGVLKEPGALSHPTDKKTSTYAIHDMRVILRKTITYPFYCALFTNMKPPQARWECLWPACRTRQSIDNSVLVQGPDTTVQPGRYSIDFYRKYKWRAGEALDQKGKVREACLAPVRWQVIPWLQVSYHHFTRCATDCTNGCLPMCHVNVTSFRRTSCPVTSAIARLVTTREMGVADTVSGQEHAQRVLLFLTCDNSLEGGILSFV